MRSIGKGFLAIVGCATALLSTGCGGGGGGGNGTAVFDPEVLFINASPDSASAKFVLDGATKADKIPFLGGTAAFARVPLGEVDVDVFLDGAVESNDSRVITFADNESVVLGALGLKTFGAEYEKRLRINRFLISRNRPNGDRARVYVLHALMFPAGDYIPQLTVKTPGKNPQFQLPDISFSNAPILDIDSGPQTLIVRRNGTENDYFSTNVTLASGGIYMAIISGVVGQVGAKAPKMKLIQLDGR